MTGGRSGQLYADRFDRLAAQGTDVHGEARLCAALVPPGSRVLDAGCGTGRVAIRLAESGYHCVGVDNDPSMLDTARARSTQVTWIHADLAALDRSAGRDRPDPSHAPVAADGPFDLIVAAGNVIPLVSPGTEASVMRGLAQRLAPHGLLVAGFGLDTAHLPLPEAPFGLAEYDAWCQAAGLTLERRLATWDVPGSADEPLRLVGTAGYAVSIHRRNAD
ncbi:SAM-dependent methyltransferase [Pseudofrankia asymbiotica]|uniref:SAM-dependent methyltransferase n=1 Tax=Pseudofrankia asymbiotica TaxID=1834516 RepID=A0A1V2I2R8_9ACTN|nr:class I SAM-dependent methyltransferase [Pseudofrankia asymbiotica]ONH24420.1 SAM-dependent methyltransferase [Pseudofrankia asymbiotica]